MRDAYQTLDELGEENDRDGFDGEGASLRLWAEGGKSWLLSLRAVLA